ncbi:MAG: hypothetical protein ACI828_001936 [Flavobacteriales bacterium]|jgi:hypothetical protein
MTKEELVPIKRIMFTSFLIENFCIERLGEGFRFFPEGRGMLVSGINVLIVSIYLGVIGCEKP